MFSKPKDTMKDKCYVFSGSTKRNKVCFVDLQCEPQKNPIIVAVEI